MDQLNIPAQRVKAIDIFRGITIFTMVFVNELAGVTDIPQWMRHLPADVDGMTFVDLVFPAFLFIVGMSVPFATQARLNKGDSLWDVFSHVLIRSISLIIIGVFMVNAEAGFDAGAMPISLPLWQLLLFISVLLIWSNLPKGRPVTWAARGLGILTLIFLWWAYRGDNGQSMTPQWWGILGLIGWAYLIAAAVYLLARNLSGAQIHLVTLGLAAGALILLFYAVDAIAPGNLLLNVWIENNRNHTHAAIVLLGIALSTLVYNPILAGQVSRNLAIFCVSLGIAALLSWQFSPISKIWATPSWALFSAFFCSLIFVAAYWLIDIKNISAWSRPFEPAATNPLLVYILPYILIALAGVLGISYRPALFDNGAMGIIWALAFAFVMLGIGALLTRSGLRLKL